MKNEWINVRINKIALAMYVPPNTGKIVHRNRPFHGFIFNSETVSRDYCFSDGTVLKTKGNDLFYLPKGSTYVVKDRASGGCYAINFDADISDTPFSVNLKNCDIIKKLFKRAAEEWDGLGVKQSAFAMSALYEAICALHKESERS